MPKDILSFINITPEAFNAYQEFAKRLAFALAGAGLDPGEIPDEQGEVKDDGSVIVYVDFPHDKGRVEFTIPPGQWSWRTDLN